MPALTNLRTLRERAALSQRDLAKIAQVAQTTVVRLEGGDPNVMPSTLRKLASALNVKPAELVQSDPGPSQLDREQAIRQLVALLREGHRLRSEAQEIDATVGE